MQPSSVEPNLADKALIVAGGTTGIGLSAARAFIKAGAKLVVIGLESPALSAAVREFASDAHCIAGDLAKPDIASEAVEICVREFGRVDGLYHVAGGSGRRLGDGPLHEMSDSGWRDTLELNLSSVMYSNRSVVRQLLKQGTGGTILNLSSVLANSPSPAYFATHAYTAAKAAIEGFTRACAAYYASC